MNSHKRSQQQRILDLLLAGFRAKREIPLPEILALRISQFGTRIKELRAAGWLIDNRQDAINGQRLSWYSLRSAIPARVIAESEKPTPKLEPAPVRPENRLNFGAQPESKQEPLFKHHVGAIGL